MVLIVEDQPLVRDILHQAVSALGYEAQVAANGQEALDRLAGQSYDVVICDLLMPHMTGDELFRVCQRIHPQVAARFVFLSGHYGGLPSTDFAATSGQPFLMKPCRLADIQAAVDQIGQRVGVA
ncbi:MAG: response regulator [Armatimonadota bacterium]